MITELSTLLLEATLATTGAALLVLALRRPLRRRFGARCAYALWLLLPLALLAIALPAPISSQLVETLDASAGSTTMAHPTMLVSAPSDPRPFLLAAWLCGSLAAAAVMVRRQRRFLARLGPLRARGDGSYLAANVDAGPAVIGLWQARIVLPLDFETRFEPLEQDLVLRHERVHVARGDLAANLAVAAAACLFWFNPLLRYALGRLRFDQELATDAAVLMQRPESRRSYADAMLKTQLSFFAPPLGCHWQSAHPLKERIAMLKQPVSSPRRHAAGSLLVAVLSLLAAFAAWAAQTPQPRGGANSAQTAAAHVRIYRGSELLTQGTFASDETGKMQLTHAGVSLAFNFETVEPDSVVIAATLDRDGERVAAPHLIGKRGTTASFAVDVEGADTLRVEFALAPLTQAPLPRAFTEVDEQATYSRIVAPKYPKSAIVAEQEGDVLLRVLVTAEGAVEQVEVETGTGYAELDEAAMATVRKWTFNPARKGNVAVPSWIGVPINFSLTGPDEPGAAPSIPQEKGTLEEIYINAR